MVAVQLRFVDAGELYVSWRWEHALDQPRVLVLPRALVQQTLDDLARAVPSPLPGESGDQALVRALTHGPLTDRVEEIALAERLARTLLPHQLAGELNAVIGQGVRPHLRVQPSPSTALVPWEALRIDDGERTVHAADVSVLPPATVRNAPERRVSPSRGPVVGVLDPRVPGFADASALGSVLGPIPDGSDLAALAKSLGGARRDDVDRDVLEAALADASRFLYVGHVTTGGHGLDARLHLSCRADTQGRAAVLGAHRPLTAADLVLGHRPGAPKPWRIPNRVALVACESGGDVRFAEPTGLVAAMVHGGAEYVASTRWTLPTDAGLAHLVPDFPPTAVLGPAVVAVDAAQSAADPVAALGAWQRERADLWERAGDPAHSPVVWAAFTTAWAPGPR
ncbi:CHAT domain-containing protein [Umezawaea tangerina]|uniref:CHAT domain-containing protein n=1 Tax=Umezawaea tangerina TaxID=84725 RepID=A0A2T0SWW2_9PSEU|nr:CHAT domain-containing protein [Umezawaea tangerina]PRY37843.1 CHAT domain-containing protein [Umezawaea tangerina]